MAFSGTVGDGGKDYTESGMNAFLEAQTARVFERPEYRFLIVANKFQTGFDQPLLHTMYVDKKLGGVNAVQTLSRLNRTHPEKKGTMVPDFANDAEEIRAAFEPYYETSLLSEATDPNLLYEIQSRLAAFPVYSESDVNAFAKIYFNPRATQDRLDAVLAPVVQGFREMADEERGFPRPAHRLHPAVRLPRPGARLCRRRSRNALSLRTAPATVFPAHRDALPYEVQHNIDMESFRIQQTGSGRIALERKAGVLEPVGTKGAYGTARRSWKHCRVSSRNSMSASA